MASVDEYFESVPDELKPLASVLRELFNQALPDCKTKVWHSIPVWFQEGNPIVTYFVKKDSVFVMFWNGQKFDVTGLKPVGKYSAADISFKSLDELDREKMQAWLIEAHLKPQTDLAMRVKVE